MSKLDDYTKNDKLIAWITWGVIFLFLAAGVVGGISYLIEKLAG